MSSSGSNPSMDDIQIIQHVLEHGKEYEPAICPDDVERGPVGHCFDHCILAAFNSDGKYRYVEGIARDPSTHDSWIYHAWLTDGEHVFDPTWRAYSDWAESKEIPVPTQYVGIEMDMKEVGKFMVATEHQAILKNGYRNPTLARACDPSYPLDSD
jgi:hypothetical protein